METTQFDELAIELQKFYVDEFNADEWTKLWTESPRLIVREYYKSSGNKKLLDPNQPAVKDKEGRDIIFLMVPKDVQPAPNPEEIKELSPEILELLNMPSKPLPSNYFRDAE